MILTYESHPITQPLTRVPTAFPLARSLDIKSGDKTTVSKLFGTTEDSVAVTSIGPGGAIDPKKGKKGPLTLAAAGHLQRRHARPLRGGGHLALVARTACWVPARWATATCSPTWSTGCPRTKT